MTVVPIWMRLLSLHLSSDLECSLSYCKYDFDLSISSVKTSSSYPS